MNMKSIPKEIQPQALEAIKADTAGMWWLYQSLQLHPKTSILVLGMVPLACMFVVESYQSLISMFPKLRSEISEQHADLLRSCRHRAKLLDDRMKTIDEVTDEVAAIAHEHRKQHLEAHTGILKPIKQLIQPDLGLYTYEGHIFSTTHAIDFGFGSNVDPAAVAFSFGESIGAYLSSLISVLQPSGSTPISPPSLSEAIEMKDLKSKALYQRGALGKMHMNYSAALALVLANLNYARYILRRVFSPKSLPLFRFKFLTAYHANSGLTAIQNRIMGNEQPSEGIQQVFRAALGNADSRWLRKQKAVRNLLTHYVMNEPHSKTLSPNATRIQAIEHLSEKLTYDEIDSLLDRHIAHLSDTLEKGFHLSEDTFWYGKVT
jgi:hypothetical protein